ncbi:uncharacterized protein [Palaemon carinicauda]|uniref:uncharacterized protein n=1 Tax=Palaemon carinicauda TaxID=392227 RepID=UPI0035B5A235
MTARAYPVGDAQIHRPNSARNRQGLLQSGQLQLKKRAPKSIRSGTLNVGIMTGRGREVADMMERRKTGCPEEEKDDFWRHLDQEMINIPNEELLMIGGDLNGHVGINSQCLERIHGGWALGDVNQDGERVLDLTVAFDMAVINTFFEKKPKYLTTYKSGWQESLIDFVLRRMVHLKEIRKRKIFPGEAVAPQHRLLTVD